MSANISSQLLTAAAIQAQYHGADELAGLCAAGRFIPVENPRHRADLTFTFGTPGNILNWYIDPKKRPQYSENGKAIGRVYFEEVRRLARSNPNEAFQVMRFAWQQMGREVFGEESGFMEEMARAALSGILANPDGLPEIPEPSE